MRDLTPQDIADMIPDEPEAIRYVVGPAPSRENPYANAILEDVSLPVFNDAQAALEAIRDSNAYRNAPTRIGILRNQNSRPRQFKINIDSPRFTGQQQQQRQPTVNFGGLGNRKIDI
jgi:stress-induced morphogen